MKDKLENYKWGLGIEHEMHIFHKPESNKYSNNKNIKDFIIFDSYSVVQRLLENKDNGIFDINEDEYNFLKSVPFETSGRKCNNKWVIKMVPVKMPEFITSHPFCSIKDGRNLLNMTNEIVYFKEKFYNILMKDKETKNLVRKYGNFSEHPFGMTRYLKCPLNIRNNTYMFEKDKKGNELLIPEYNGSYHITFTLPHNDKTTNKDFIKMHQNFANQLQWLEPLMLTAYFTGDEYSPGTLKERVRGSFRVMIIGWGNLAGSDVRLFNKGIGRYAKTPTYWREGLYFEDVDKLKPCYKPSVLAQKEGATSSLSSDFRTFGSTDPLRPMHRESGIGMTKPNGIEFRIFDHFSDKYIDNLVMLISLVAENSRIHTTRGYVYQNKIWIKELHNIMKNGYKARLSKAYINLLKRKLGLEIKTSSIIAYDIFKQIYDELWNKNINGSWSKIFHNYDNTILRSAKGTISNRRNYEKIVIPQINKKGWQFAFMIKLNRNKKLLHKFNFLSRYLNHIKNISYNDFEMCVIEIFGNNWKNDVEDIIYFYESLKIVKLIKNKNGTIKNIELLLQIGEFQNLNKEIIDYFSDDILRNIL
jgi:hypothetical protein